MNNKTVKAFLFFLAGLIILVAGIALMLVCWKEVVVVFKGAAGVVLALAGLLILAMAKE